MQRIQGFRIEDVRNVWSGLEPHDQIFIVTEYFQQLIIFQQGRITGNEIALGAVIEGNRAASKKGQKEQQKRNADDNSSLGYDKICPGINQACHP